MNFFWEVAFLAIGYGIAIWMLHQGFPAVTTQRGGNASQYAYAALAWLPVRIFTYWLWAPATGHHSHAYPWWFWLIFGVALITIVVSALSPRIDLLWLVWMLGAALVVIPLFYIGWFKPGSAHGNALHARSLWVTLFIMAAVLMVVGGLVWLVHRDLAVVVLVAAVLTACAALSFCLMGSSSHHSKNTAAAKPSASASASATHSASASASPTPSYHASSASQCAPNFNVVYDPNEEKDLVSGGAPVDAYPTAQSAITKLTDAMKQDTRILYVYYTASPEQKLQPITNEAELRGTGQNDGCYSQAGMNAYNAYLVELAHAKLENVQAPATGVNTGANPGGGAFQAPVGKITGKLDAVKITYADGTVVYVLRRCLNEELPAPSPTLPVVTPTPTQSTSTPTPTPTPSQSTTTTPPPTQSTTPPPTKTTTSTPPPTKTTTPPPTKTTTPPSPPVLLSVTRIQSVVAGQSSGNFCATPQLPPGDKGTLTFATDLGKFGTTGTVQYTVSNNQQECAIYTAPNDVAGTQDTITVYLQDSSTGLSATPSVQTFNILPVTTSARP
ncbi:MAG: hypothetical protein WDN27_04470 [Candidatus Saccharibacteria bacterium]